MYLYSIRSIEQTTNSYSGKRGVCCYLFYEPETSLHGETALRFFLNNPLKHLKSPHIKHHCICPNASGFEGHVSVMRAVETAKGASI
jgi:hypothetical protein